MAAPAGPRPRPPVRTARVAFTGTYAGGPWANIVWFHLGGSAEITQANLKSFTTFAGSAWGSNLVAKMYQTVTLTHAHTLLYGADLDLLEADDSFALSGTGTVAPQAASVAACITWTVGIGYRGGHPRSYLPGVHGTQLLDVRNMTGTAASSLAAGASTFHTSMEGYTNASIASVEHVCMSFVRNKQWRTPPVHVRITGAYVDARLDSQRRRLGRDIP